MAIYIKLPYDTEDKAFGAWIDTGKKKDVHVLIENGSVVIGHNGKHTYSLTNPFTDIALVITDDGKPHIQYADEEGELKTVNLTQKEISSHIMKFLEELKALAEDK